VIDQACDDLWPREHINLEQTPGRMLFSQLAAERLNLSVFGSGCRDNQVLERWNECLRLFNLIQDIAL
jgi:hypothetical protein